jgi:AraC-like DNA-binding protein
MVHELPGERGCVGRHGNELIVAMMVRVLRESLEQPAWTPKRVAFAHAAPLELEPLRAFFGTDDISFDAGRNELAVPPSDFALPLRSADAALLAVLDEQAMRLVSDRGGADQFWSRLREHVRVSLRDGPPRLETAAVALGTSPRTLQRRLEEKGTTFHALVEGLREELARLYLEGGALAPLEIAFLLGYADRRAFVRAFKRWTGETPSGYRRR